MVNVSMKKPAIMVCVSISLCVLIYFTATYTSLSVALFWKSIRIVLLQIIFFFFLLFCLDFAFSSCLLLQNTEEYLCHLPHNSYVNNFRISSRFAVRYLILFLISTLTFSFYIFLPFKFGLLLIWIWKFALTLGYNSPEIPFHRLISTWML